MPDPYQRGSDEDWLKAERDELQLHVEKRDRQIARLTLIIIALLAALGWVAYKFRQAGGKFEDLLRF